MRKFMVFCALDGVTEPFNIDDGKITPVKLFSLGTLEHEQNQPNNVMFKGVDQETEIVTIKDSGGNYISYDYSGAITLPDGTYSIEITRKDGSNTNKYNKIFVADGKSCLTIVEPLLYSAFSGRNKNAEGIAAEFYFTVSDNALDISKYLNVKQNNSAGSYSIQVGSRIVFKSDKKIIIRAFDITTTSETNEEIAEWKFSLWGSNDGENWIRIAENSTTNECNPIAPVFYGNKVSRFLRTTFDESNNPGYLFNRIQLDEQGRYQGFFALWLSEAYWKE